MPPHIVNLHYTLRYAAPLVLVLEAAPDRWQVIYNLATALLERLPGRCQTLYFLGNRNPYPVTLTRDLREQAPTWYNANRERVSCLGPLIETLEQESYTGHILIIASQYPVDLDDVRQTPVTSRLLLVNISEIPFTTTIEQVDGRQGVERVLSALEDPPRALQITAPGFVPLGYDLREGWPRRSTRDKRGVQARHHTWRRAARSAPACHRGEPTCAHCAAGQGRGDASERHRRSPLVARTALATVARAAAPHRRSWHRWLHLLLPAVWGESSL